MNSLQQARGAIYKEQKHLLEVKQDLRTTIANFRQREGVTPSWLQSVERLYKEADMLHTTWLRRAPIRSRM